MDIQEITLEELADLPESTYVLYDTRDEISWQYDTIPGADHVPDLWESARAGQLPMDKKIVLFCMHGTESAAYTQALSHLGFDAWNLKGGYAAWLQKQMRHQDRSAEIEETLRGRSPFHKKLFVPFAKAINKYQMIRPGDRIAVCISGGKDSMLMAKLFQELKRHRQIDFEPVFLVMDPGYNDLNRALIEDNAVTMGVPLTFFRTSIFDAVDKVDKNPCYLCARMRRGNLYAKAKELGCCKIALGHHFDDVIETTLMGMLWGGQIQAMMPKLHSEHFEGMELIRPMYFVREDDIKAWRDYNRLHFIQCACHFTDTCSSCRTDGSPVSKRMQTKLLIRELKKTNPGVEQNLLSSVHNVNLDMVIAYKENGVKHSFLEKYDRQ